LERLGQRVEFPLEQTCCGQMHANSGYFEPSLVRRYADTFTPYDAIVTPSASCAGAIRHQHVMIARAANDDALAARAQQTADKTYELSEFLTDVLHTDDVGAYFPHRVTYHPTCHSLRMLHVGDRPLRLLNNVRGIELVPLPDEHECCGFGGTFSIKNPDVSAAMLADKMESVIETGAEVVCAGDRSCLMHIGGGLDRIRAGVRTLHLAEILASTEERPA
jgi:L-lactate dehydrogenase complex protein LldE